MEGRCGLNIVKSFVGKNVNLHLKDGSVIINVHLTRIRRSEYGKEKLIEYVPYRNRRISKIPLRSIAWVELLNLSIMQRAG